MKMFLLAFSFLSISLSSITPPDTSVKLACKTLSICLENRACYALEVCGTERELQKYPKGIGGFMGDEKAMVVSGFPPSFNGKSIIIKPNTSLRLTKRGKTNPSFKSRSVLAGKYIIKGGKTTLKLGNRGK